MLRAMEYSRNRLWQAIVWTLRVTVALQCVANWRWLTQLEETPLLHWMIDPIDVGGLAWSESTGLAVQQGVGWFLLVAAGWVLWRPQALVLVPVVLVQLLMTVAMWRLAEGYPLQAPWLSPRVLMLFPFMTQVARIAAPLGLLMISDVFTVSSTNSVRVARTMQLLRWAIAIVFLAHGLEALLLNPVFVDLLINASRRVLGYQMVQSAAERCLFIIGGIDILVATLCVSFRWRVVMGWIAFWGAVTAFSRVAANGWTMSWHEAITRTPHFGIPLAVVLWWHLLECEEAAAADAANEIETPAGNIKSAANHS